MKAGEWNRKAFNGTELYGKTLGVLGLGRIGTELARRAIAFGMRVMAYDPYLSLSRAKALQVELVEPLDELYASADFITVHMPLSDETRNAVNLPSLDAKTYAEVKPFLTLAEKLGRVVAQLAPKRNDRIIITYGGKATELPTDPVTRALLVGFLKSAGGQDVNQVNVQTLAHGLGLLVEEI